MIIRLFNKYCGVCDCCGEKTEQFPDWYECKDWIKDNWKMRYNFKNHEWEHLCDKCKK